MLLRIGQEDESVSKYGFNVCEIQKVKYTKHLSARVYQTELLNKKCVGQECDEGWPSGRWPAFMVEVLSRSQSAGYYHH